MNRFWLIKFAPFRFSWEDILRSGQFEIYSVRNAQARNNLKEMNLDDDVLFYHSQEDNRIIGRMKVVTPAHQDPTTSDPQWVSVTFEPTETLPNPVSLSLVRSTPELANIALLRQPRLAVSELTEAEFNTLMKLAN